MRSNPTTERQWEVYGEEGQRQLVERIALKRLGTPRTSPRPCCSSPPSYAGWITGQVLSVDGGK